MATLPDPPHEEMPPAFCVWRRPAMTPAWPDGSESLEDCLAPP